MSIAHILTKYQCPDCSELYDSPDAAAECCPPEIEVKFVCSECADEFDFESGAREHTENDHEIERDAFGLPLISKAELEEAGQLRLIP